MRSLIFGINNALRSKKGETLVEAIVSILLLTILLGTITAMIHTSLRLTANTMQEADGMQNDVFNPAIFDTQPNLSPGSLSFGTLSTTLIDTQHDIYIFDNTGDMVSFYPDTGQFED